MSWREDVLGEFPPHVHRLTLAADPDGLLTEEGVAAELERRGYEIVDYGDDPIAFRYAYERDYRSRWESGEESCLIVLVRGESRELDALPYDLVRPGRKLSFGLGDLLPNLDYSTVSELDREYLDRLYTAYRRHAPRSLLGRSATSDYVLLHVFGVAPETVSSREDLIGLLLKRHYEGWMVPQAMDVRLLASLRSGSRFEDWPLEEILPRREAFLTFLQERWPIFLRRKAEREGLGVKEPAATYETRYSGPKELPFDSVQMRVYVDNMFLEGMLDPVSSPVDEPETARLTDGWVSFGLETSPEQDKARRLEGLLDNARESIPASLANHSEWLAFARKWAELTVLRYAQNSAESTHADEAFAELRGEVDEAFLAWVEERYGGLHNLSSTAMVHHIPRLMARRMGDGEVGKMAFVVVDGLSLGQWVPLRDVLMQRGSGLRFEESAVFAWVPTITPVSRQAIFAANPPAFFPASINTTSKEKTLWRRFWVDSVGLDPREMSYANLSGDGDAREIEEEISHRTKVAGIVVQKVDRIMHGMELGERGMHSQVRQWAEEGYLAGLISSLVDCGFEVYLTSDHGNVEARGIGNPGEGAVADICGERVRVYDDSEQRSRVAGEFPGSVEWSGSGLPKDYLPLLAPGRTAFVARNRRIVGHGGISLEELAVPFVHVEQRASGGDI
jgi:hypothetical protein